MFRFIENVFNILDKGLSFKEKHFPKDESANIPVEPLPKKKRDFEYAKNNDYYHCLKCSKDFETNYSGFDFFDDWDWDSFSWYWLLFWISGLVLGCLRGSSSGFRQMFEEESPLFITLLFAGLIIFYLLPFLIKIVFNFLYARYFGRKFKNELEKKFKYNSRYDFLISIWDKYYQKTNYRTINRSVSLKRLFLLRRNVKAFNEDRNDFLIDISSEEDKKEKLDGIGFAHEDIESCMKLIRNISYQTDDSRMIEIYHDELTALKEAREIALSIIDSIEGTLIPENKATNAMENGSNSTLDDNFENGNKESVQELENLKSQHQLALLELHSLKNERDKQAQAAFGIWKSDRKGGDCVPEHLAEYGYLISYAVQNLLREYEEVTDENMKSFLLELLERPSAQKTFFSDEYTQAVKDCNTFRKGTLAYERMIFKAGGSRADVLYDSILKFTFKEREDHPTNAEKWYQKYKSTLKTR